MSGSQSGSVDWVGTLCARASGCERVFSELPVGAAIEASGVQLISLLLCSDFQRLSKDSL